ALITRIKHMQNCHLAQVEIDEVLGLVSHITAEVSAHDAVPRGIILLVKLLMGSNIFLDVVLLHRLCGTVHRILLHVLGHVGILDHSLPVSHGACVQQPETSGRGTARWKRCP
uniref:Uncharacterized protein n=1 Tax=Paramormyrops kingsleyae TaxID=1676925 RepID=A0A3B3SQY0_9TELE